MTIRLEGKKTSWTVKTQSALRSFPHQKAREPFRDDKILLSWKIYVDKSSKKQVRK